MSKIVDVSFKSEMNNFKGTDFSWMSNGFKLLFISNAKPLHSLYWFESCHRLRQVAGERSLRNVFVK